MKKVAFVRQHAEGGVAVMARPVMDSFCAVYEVVEVVADDKQPIPADVAHAHFFNLGAMASYHRTLQCPTSATIHHMTYGYEDHYIKMLEYYKPNYIHVLDEFTRRQLGRRGWYCVMRIPQFITDLPTMMPLPKVFTLGAFGGDAQYKRLSVVQDIADELEVPCIIHDSDKEPWLSPLELTDFYKKISCYVVASFEDGGPIPPFQAMAAGRGVVSTYVGQLTDYRPLSYNPMTQIVPELAQVMYFDGSVEDGARVVEVMRKYMEVYRHGEPFAFAQQERKEYPLGYHGAWAGLFERARLRKEKVC